MIKQSNINSGFSVILRYVLDNSYRKMTNVSGKIIKTKVFAFDFTKIMDGNLSS